MSQIADKTKESQNRNCPLCGVAGRLERQKMGIQKILAFGFLGDLGSLLLAIIFFGAISALSFAGAYGLAAFIIFGGGLYMISKSPDYKCTNCMRVYNKEDVLLP